MVANGFALLLTISVLPAMGGSEGAASEKPVAQMFVTSDRCLACHNGLVTPSGQDVSIGANWQSSMMAHASRDPYWQAAVRRETLDHPTASEAIQHECAACHMPMARYHAKVNGRKEPVFAHLPITANPLGADLLAADAVSCTMCHQIQPDKLGTKASFTAGFVVDTQTPLDERVVFGPYDVDGGRTRVMRSSAMVVPTKSTHIQGSELCASCHTLFTHAFGPNGEVVGELPEQVPYLEWKHSAYAEGRSCQSCHMPQLDDEMHITAVLGQPREGFSRHSFRGGNFFMPQIFKRYRQELGVKAPSESLDMTVEQTRANLTDSAASVEIGQAAIEASRLEVEVNIANLAGHKLPTAYPSRRAWIQLTVKDKDGQVVFESGSLKPDGSISGNDNDADRTTFEPHYTEIARPDQVQIYEAIMADSQDKVTTGLLSAVRYVKDNRIPPIGFDKSTADKDIAVHGKAYADEDFAGGRDNIRYSIPVNPRQGPFTVEAKLWYQPIGFRWAQNLKLQQAAEIDRFVSYYDAMSEKSGIVIAENTKTVR
mgnify:CR=1 FL=1